MVTTIKLIKFLDRLIGKGMALCLPSPRRRRVGEVRAILVIRPGGIGDAVLLLPALKALVKVFPDACVDVLGERRNAAAFRFISGVGTVRCYDAGSDLCSVLSRRYDVVIDTEQSYRLSAVVARLTRAPVLVGFGTNERGRLFTDAVPYPHDAYEADAFLRLLQPLRLPAPASLAIPFVELPEGAQEEAIRLLAPLGGRRFVVLFPGASVPEKLWEPERFRQVVAALNRRGVPVVLVGGKDTAVAAEKIAQGNDVLDLSGRTSLLVTAAVIELGELLIGGDSGLLHIGVGLGRATVSLFGPSDPQKWGPRGERHQVVSAALPCAPCSRFGTIPTCANAVRCLSAISVAEVLAAVESVLAAGEERSQQGRGAADAEQANSQFLEGSSEF